MIIEHYWPDPPFPARWFVVHDGQRWLEVCHTPSEMRVSIGDTHLHRCRDAARESGSSSLKDVFTPPTVGRAKLRIVQSRTFGPKARENGLSAFMKKIDWRRIGERIANGIAGKSA